MAATSILTEVAHELVREVLHAHPEESHISLLAISVSHLEHQPELQLELSLGLADEAWRPGARRGASRLFADKAMDKVRDRFGWEAIGYGSVMLEGRRFQVRAGRVRWFVGPLRGWGASRELPALPAQTFREWWEQRGRGA